MYYFLEMKDTLIICIDLGFEITLDTCIYL